MSSSNRKGRTKSNSELPELDVTGICDEWDGYEDIRERMRQGQTFIHPEGTKDDVRSCTLNSSILVPLLTRMSTLDHKPLPGVEPLRLELEKLWLKNKRVNSPEECELVVKSSWRVKKLLGFVKMKVRREEVSSATCLYISIVCCCSYSHLICVEQTNIWHWSPLLINTTYGSSNITLYSPFEVEVFQNLCIVLNPLLQAGRFLYPYHIANPFGEVHNMSGRVMFYPTPNVNLYGL